MLAVGFGTKTDFMYAGRLNSQQLNRYMAFMLGNGLLDEAPSEGNSTLYRISPRGEKALSKLQEIMGLLGLGADADS